MESEIGSGSGLLKEASQEAEEGQDLVLGVKTNLKAETEVSVLGLTAIIIGLLLNSLVSAYPWWKRCVYEEQ
jgi:hypothetical protein